MTDANDVMASDHSGASGKFSKSSTNLDSVLSNKPPTRKSSSFTAVPTDAMDASFQLTLERQFIETVEDSLKDENTSANAFAESFPEFRNLLSSAEDILDCDRQELKKMLKAMKEMSQAAERMEIQSNAFAEVLHRHGDLQINQVESPLGPAFSKFSVINREVSGLHSAFLKGPTLTAADPLDKMIKSEDSVSDLKKQYEKSVQRWKHKRKQTKTDKPDGGEAEMELELEKEKIILQIATAEHLTKMKDLKARKEIDLLFSLVELYRNQTEFFKQGLASLNTLQPYMAQLTTDLDEWRAVYFNEREDLLTLKDKLKSHLNDVGRRQATAANSNAQIIGSSNIHGQLEGEGVSQDSHKGGWVYQQSKNFKAWRKRWCCVKDGIIELAHSPDSSHMKRIQLILCTVKEEPIDGKRHCFRLQSTRKIYFLAVESASEMNSWISVIRNAINDMHSLNFYQESHLSDGPQENFATFHRFRNEAQEMPGNSVCADCGASGPKWISLNLGVFLCIACSGIHREMGVHTSKVRSITLDKLKKTDVLMLKGIGNYSSNRVYEGSPSMEKIKERTPMQARKTYIMAKYQDKAFLTPLSSLCELPQKNLLEPSESSQSTTTATTAATKAIAALSKASPVTSSASLPIGTTTPAVTKSTSRTNSGSSLPKRTPSSDSLTLSKACSTLLSHSSSSVKRLSLSATSSPNISPSSSTADLTAILATTTEGKLLNSNDAETESPPVSAPTTYKTAPFSYEDKTAKEYIEIIARAIRDVDLHTLNLLHAHDIDLMQPIPMKMLRRLFTEEESSKESDTKVNNNDNEHINNSSRNVDSNSDNNNNSNSNSNVGDNTKNDSQSNSNNGNFSISNTRNSNSDDSNNSSIYNKDNTNKNKNSNHSANNDVDSSETTATTTTTTTTATTTKEQENPIIQIEKSSPGLKLNDTEKYKSIATRHRSNSQTYKFNDGEEQAISGLHVAALKGLTLVLEFFLNVCRMDVNSKTIVKENTPMHYAAIGQNVDCIRLLLVYDADLTLENTEHKLAHDLALETFISRTSRHSGDEETDDTEGEDDFSDNPGSIAAAILADAASGAQTIPPSVRIFNWGPACAYAYSLPEIPTVATEAPKVKLPSSGNSSYTGLVDVSKSDTKESIASAKKQKRKTASLGSKSKKKAQKEKISKSGYSSGLGSGHSAFSSLAPNSTSTSLPVTSVYPSVEKQTSKPCNRETPIRCVALYNCTSDNNTELEFKRSDVLYVFECHDDGWWGAFLESDPTHEGLVPSNYLKIDPN